MRTRAPTVGIERLVGVAGAIRRRFAAEEHGATVALVAVSMVAIISTAALAIDPARAYVLRTQLSRAVDGGSLAGARALRLGQPVAYQRAISVAAANDVVDGQNGVNLTVGFGTNVDGEQTVAMTATQTMPTVLMRMLGPDQITVASQAVAAVPPIDMVLVLDQSGSLGSAGAWDDLQQAAITFKDNFDDVIDQMGLVSFQIRATDRFMLAQPFRSAVETEILNMQSSGDTNTGEGLRLALLQMQGANVRERSVKVVVFFTDGRPTALRGMINGQDRMMAVYTTHNNGRMRGYFNNPDQLPTDQVASPSGCQNFSTCFTVWTGPSIRDQARINGTDQADQIRAAGFFLYAIGLGNPAASDPLLQPDMAYLQVLANENGMTDPSQPQGKAYFAPSAAELQTVFQQVAADILVRLAQ